MSWHCACGAEIAADCPNQRNCTGRTLVDCPKCGGETAVQRWSAHDSSIGIDTSVRYCIECDWQADPE